MDLGTWAREAALEAVHAHVHRWMIVHKRRSKSVQDAYVTMPLWVAAELLAEDQEVTAPTLGRLA